MSDSLDNISALTGIPRSDMLKIWDMVKANQARLNACPRHRFKAVELGKVGTKYECSCCGGTTDVSSVSWYEKGLAHATKGEPLCG